jgi:16S rRNA (cytidine1402-2'-O)-methyltransferase
LAGVSQGRLIVCATPIGNLGDISERLRVALASADVIYAEDTRRTAKLLNHLAVSTPMRSLFVGNEAVRGDELVEAVADGQTVVIVSDAGMPTVSDPGADAIRRVREAGLPIVVVPGPSAVTTAIAVSGFGGDRFVFEGFLPRRGRERNDRLDALGSEKRAVVLFASPRRLPKDLSDLREACGGEREVAVTRELTKLHEEVWVGPLDEAVFRFGDEVKGEVTLVLGPIELDAPSLESALSRARSLVSEGVSVSEAARSTASELGVSRRALYQALLTDDASS